MKKSLKIKYLKFKKKKKEKRKKKKEKKKRCPAIKATYYYACVELYRLSNNKVCF